MMRNPSRQRSRVNRFRRPKRKPCALCVERTDYLDYKSQQRLRKFVSDRGKILPRKTSGTCARHQRIVCDAIKRAREIAILPFVAD